MISQILEAVATKKRILILAHNNPDPDAMGAATALKHIFHVTLKKKCIIAYMGIIGRLENRELVKQCHIEMQQTLGLNFRRFDYVIVVDSQPQAGNVWIPDGLNINLVVDHHLIKRQLPKRKDLIADIRPAYGSTCSIVSEYMKELNIVPDANIATSFCFGIMTDVMGVARSSCQIDQNMLGFLLPYISMNKLSRIQNPVLPRYYFKTLKRAIENSVIIDDLLFCNLGEVRNADLIAESADYLLRMRDIRCVFVMGKLELAAFFSLRYKTMRKSVGRIAMSIVKGIGYGGGHMKSAGGHIPIKDKSYDDVANTLKERLIKRLGLTGAEKKPL